ncbi:C-type lectin domain family 4 member F [Drosophila ficusphila]|uniref:C-type lectin domain family 4 member F n=1 Tax=Drosophila ficusphila TaxID=30025 RepID=UPI0007E6F4D4|nr:C-type lectin domain family 4 member F [Drosophila ficusphila]
MLKLSVFLFCVVTLGLGYGSGNQSEDLESRCNGHCFSRLRTVMDYVAENQDRWNTCKEIIANDTRVAQNQMAVQLESLQGAVGSMRISQESRDAKLDRMEGQLNTTRECLSQAIPKNLTDTLGRMDVQLTALETELRSRQNRQDPQLTAALTDLKDIQDSNYASLGRIEKGLISTKESLRETFPATLQDRLVRMEAQLKSMDSRLQSVQSKIEGKLTEIQGTLTKMHTKIIPPGFQLIGSRYFYIEESNKQTWNSAARTCRQMGGHLASIKSEKEWNLINEKLEDDTFYWLGIYEKARKGNFVSVASDADASFIKWKSTEPKYVDDSLHCVLGKCGVMYVDPCNIKSFLFICQADDE